MDWIVIGLLPSTVVLDGGADVMYNVDQLLFQFCTAKNSDNTQCCMPVIDLTHDFPLCFPHALQAVGYC